MSLERREVVAVDVHAPVATVWEHLRDPRLVRRWFGWDHDGLDAEILEIFAAGVHEEHDHADGLTTRSLRWRNHDHLTVSAHDDRPTLTRVAVTRPSHDGLSTFDGVFDAMDEGWTQYVHQLAFALEVHPGKDRVTLTSHGLDAGGRSQFTALQLAWEGFAVQKCAFYGSVQQAARSAGLQAGCELREVAQRALEVERFAAGRGRRVPASPPQIIR